MASSNDPAKEIGSTAMWHCAQTGTVSIASAIQILQPFRIRFTHSKLPKR